jgi:DNA-directed RNA polymerase subunit RPC12/RpoP
LTSDESDAGLSCHQCGHDFTEDEAYAAIVSGECPACGYRYDPPK